MKAPHFISIRGKQHEWSFDVEVDPKDVQDYRDDGLEIYAIENTVPEWLPSGATRAWCFLQDLLKFRWLTMFAKR